jgi:hypothetical protein
VLHTNPYRELLCLTALIAFPMPGCSAGSSRASSDPSVASGDGGHSETSDLSGRADAACAASPPPPTNAASEPPSEGGPLTVDSDASADAGSDSSMASTLALDGDWLFCDEVVQGSPEDESYLTHGGMRLHLAMEGGSLVARNLDEMDRPTTAFITGSLNVTTRQWVADLLWPHGGDDGGETDRFAGAVQLTFNQEGTRFDGTGPCPQLSANGPWLGGRVDGTFQCPP